MAICEWCDQEMMTATSCPGNMTIKFPDGTEMLSIHYNPPSHICHDCNVEPGQKHHPGCDMERCPRCDGQLISCGCLDEPEADDDDM